MGSGEGRRVTEADLALLRLEDAERRATWECEEWRLLPVVWECEECRAPWLAIGNQCHRCGNRTRLPRSGDRAI